MNSRRLNSVAVFYCVLMVVPLSGQAEVLIPGHILIVDQGVDAVFQVDPTTGHRTVISSSSVGFSAKFSFTPGDYLGVNGDILVADGGTESIVRVDAATGNRTVFSGPNVGLGTAFTFPRSIKLTASGDFLVTDANSSMFRVDASTGNRTVVSGLGVGSGPAFDNLTGGLDANGDIFVSNRYPSGGTDDGIWHVDPVYGKPYDSIKLQ